MVPEGESPHTGDRPRASPPASRGSGTRGPNGTRHHTHDRPAHAAGCAPGVVGTDHQPAESRSTSSDVARCSAMWRMTCVEADAGGSSAAVGSRQFASIPVGKAWAQLPGETPCLAAAWGPRHGGSPRRSWAWSRGRPVRSLVRQGRRRPTAWSQQATGPDRRSDHCGSSRLRSTQALLRCPLPCVAAAQCVSSWWNATEVDVVVAIYLHVARWFRSSREGSRNISTTPLRRQGIFGAVVQSWNG